MFSLNSHHDISKILSKVTLKILSTNDVKQIINRVFPSHYFALLDQRQEYTCTHYNCSFKKVKLRHAYTSVDKYLHVFS